MVVSDHWKPPSEVSTIFSLLIPTYRSQKYIPKWLIVTSIVVFSIAFKLLLGLAGYSGEGTPPQFGDFEAQRHWMEITWHLPPTQWYVHSDINPETWWRLDYPPLSAYWSWICGAVISLVHPQMIALEISRGIEEPLSRFIMRLTALCGDVLVLTSAGFALAFLSTLSSGWSFKAKTVFFALFAFAPVISEIDHGHFQYNAMSLGLTAWAAYFLVHNHDLLSAVAFTLALTYKQMSLYHAPAFFAVMLSRVLSEPSFLRKFFRLAILGSTVILTLAVVFAPFAVYGGTEGFLAVIIRIFPVHRGLYEDKVANLWCTFEPFFRVREKFSQPQLVKMCLSLTSIMLLPGCVAAFLKPSPKRLFLCLLTSSLAFFLASYHVHEKSILIPAVAVLLLAPVYPQISSIFRSFALFSMIPLMVKDAASFAGLALLLFHSVLFFPLRSTSYSRQVYLAVHGFMAVLLVVLFTVQPPTHLPDLWTLAVTASSCGAFGLLWLAASVEIWRV